MPGSKSSRRPATAVTATELCRRLRPDVITMDVMMPMMDGVTATEYIMANCRHSHPGGFRLD